ncbi:GNAT family N-acetyltransferase [Vibrio quintilis]|uniref:N-acetyltransferase domain-containing protein n=1 Tax=Vibrio quintilis TaxID=1117707 RepID=A0A1M7Z294_9VIBR|nr:GNAT family protein [Vibrio quintilis]SHO58942.1 hypothetical protein VQ7734_04717 [Vibrio quintilis]
MNPDLMQTEQSMYTRDIRIIRMNIRHLPEVSRLKVNDDQLPFVGHIQEILTIISGTVYPHLVMAGEQVAGFFLIDTAYGDQYDFAPVGCLGLRAFFIDQKFQGLGCGKQAVRLLPAYLQSEYPAYQEVYLTVNCRNPGARHCYLSADFQDTNALYSGGSAGPQHIMKLVL